MYRPPANRIHVRVATLALLLTLAAPACMSSQQSAVTPAPATPLPAAPTMAPLDTTGPAALTLDRIFNSDDFATQPLGQPRAPPRLAGKPGDVGPPTYSRR